MPQLVSGEIMEVSKGVECRTEHFPLGVVASIVPFNFPLMVPNWTMPNALVLGNTMIMKPSELVPLSCLRMAELLKEAGFENGKNLPTIKYRPRRQLSLCVTIFCEQYKAVF